MATPYETIHVAYAHSVRHGYRAVAYVDRNRIRHTRRTGLGDTADDAMREAIAYIADEYRRDGLPHPDGETVYHGRMAGRELDGVFGLLGV